MPNIPFPNVPSYPGVPQLTRPVSAVIASNPALAVSIGALGGILADTLQQNPQWGIFDADGNQLGIRASGGASILSALASQITGDLAPVLSTLSIDYSKETKIADFPIEGGGFANYNKVESPGNAVVTLTLSGTEDDRTNFLTALDAACISTEGYNVVTPTITYVNYSIERYVYGRRANKGAVLLIVDVSLKEIRQVSAAFATVASPITQPQDANATPQTNNGITQAKPPDSSILRSISDTITGFHFFGGN